MQDPLVEKVVDRDVDSATAHPGLAVVQAVALVMLVTTQDTVAHCITAVVAVAAGGLVVALVDTEAVALAAKQLRTTDIAIV